MADCKRLEKEMDDFKNNKDSKLKEIKVSWIFPTIGRKLTIRLTSRTRRRNSASRLLRLRPVRRRFRLLNLNFVSLLSLAGETS